MGIEIDGHSYDIMMDVTYKGCCDDSFSGMDNKNHKKSHENGLLHGNIQISYLGIMIDILDIGFF